MGVDDERGHNNPIFTAKAQRAQREFFVATQVARIQGSGFRKEAVAGA
jgi:hypothetical protein